MITRILFISACLAMLTVGLFIGLEREAERKAAMAERNCQLYGDAINKTYGKEVC